MITLTKEAVIAPEKYRKKGMATEESGAIVKIFLKCTPPGARRIYSGGCPYKMPR